MGGRAAWLLGALILATALAGCAGTDDGDDDGGTGTTGPTGTGGTRTTGATTGTGTQTGGPTTGTGTQTGGPGQRSATMTADATSGTAPVNITFTLDATGSLDGATWRIGFGDGSEEEGDGPDLPIDVTHEYVVGGNFTAVFAVTYAGGGTVEATPINVTIATPSGDAPPQLVWEFGQVLGCDSTLHALSGGVVPPTCASYAAGPSGEVVDAVWIPLDARYVGRTWTSTIAQLDGGHDSDCSVFAPDATTYVAEGNNGGDPCEGGPVPEGAGWLLLWPYVVPSEEMVLTFSA